MLTTHFSFAELAANGAPSDVERSLLCLCAAVLEPVRLRWGRVLVTSGYRPGALTDGGRRSQHALGEAVDINLLDAKRRDVWEWLMRAKVYGLPIDQAVIYPASGGLPATRHIHVSHTLRRKPRGEFLVRTASGIYEPWSSGMLSRFGDSL